MAFNLKPPYLFYIGSAIDIEMIKMTTSSALFTPDNCVGVMSEPSCTLQVPGTTRMDIKTAIEQGTKSFVLGTVNAGGIIPKEWNKAIKEAITSGLDIVNGMHTPLESIHLDGSSTFGDLASHYNVNIHNIRLSSDQSLSVEKGTPRADKRLLSVGTDCSIGKMFSSLILTQSLKQVDIPAQFIATGQCGILIADGHGIAIDAVPSDFISGSIESLTPSKDNAFYLIEGQGSLFHPAFSGVTLGLLHGAQADYFIVCHEPNRSKMRDTEFLLPTLEETLELTLQLGRRTNPNIQCVGICLNTSRLTETEAQQACDDYKHLNVPVTDPYRFGITPITDHITSLLENKDNV